MKREHAFFGCGCLGGGAAGMVFGFLLAMLAWVVHEEEIGTTSVPFNAAFGPVEGDEAVGAVLAAVRNEHRMPAMAAALVRSEGEPRIAVVGTRKRGEEVPVTLDDLWHLGSNTKAMTATLAAVMVEAGDLRWDTKVGDVFPELPREKTPGLLDATLEQLLSHWSGLPRNLDRRDVSREGSPREQRLEALRTANAQGLEHAPGEHHEYSNLGYTVVGAMLEQLADKPWEDLIRERVFAPLGMETCGFGGTGTPGEIDQPWPHGDNGVPVPENGPDVDNPPIFGPGGRVHCSMTDWAKFVQDQLRGARGMDGLLRAETYTKLHAPMGDADYAMGWTILERPWGGGTVMNHGGSNTMNQANVWVAPKRDFALLVCTNQGGDAAFNATDAAVASLLQLAQDSSR